MTEAPIVTIADIRNHDKTLADKTKFPAVHIAAARDAVEEEFELITNRSFTVRAKYWSFLSGGGDLAVMPDNDIQRVTSFMVNGTDAMPSLLGVTPGYLEFLPAPEGAAVEVRYEYGLFPPPADVRRAALIRVRDLLISANSAIPDRAVSFQVSELGTYQLATAGRAGAETGIPEVDAILARYKAQRWAL
ncbi:hypothetical protein [Streptomyces smyrnaeus]|uniref:hypothetical protein n=1 Tax=Streptomyces smyrnaeus TaxID=1387713 RepID=UPI0036BFA8AB